MIFTADKISGFLSVVKMAVGLKIITHPQGRVNDFEFYQNCCSDMFIISSLTLVLFLFFRTEIEDMDFHCLIHCLKSLFFL